MYQPLSFHEEILLGPYRYDLSFNGQEVDLAYRNCIIGSQYRVNAGLVFWGDEPTEVYDDLELNTHAFALARRVLPILAHRMAELQPPEFNLSANTPRKIRPYQRFARQLHLYLSHLYHLEYTEKGARFTFDKKQKSERQNQPLPKIIKNGDDE